MGRLWDRWLLPRPRSWLSFSDFVNFCGSVSVSISRSLSLSRERARGRAAATYDAVLPPFIDDDQAAQLRIFVSRLCVIPSKALFCHSTRASRRIPPPFRSPSLFAQILPCCFIHSINPTFCAS